MKSRLWSLCLEERLSESPSKENRIVRVISRKGESFLLEEVQNGHEESTHHLHFPPPEGTHNLGHKCTLHVYPSDN